MLKAISALPIRDIITYDIDGTIRINGKKLEPDQAIMLRDGAIALENNQTRKIINDQITYEAIKMGVHSSLTLDMVLFAKAALWIQEQEKRLIKELSGENTEVV